MYGLPSNHQLTVLTRIEKSNQRNLGIIRSSNLCTEIVQFSSASETAVCNLASLALPSFTGQATFDFRRLYETCKVVVRNLNRVIDLTEYPVEEARVSNMRHRPIGVGVQGLADVFMKLGMAFESEDAASLNIQIFETIYYAALEASAELASVDGPYDSWVGSPAERGQLQYDLWGVSPSPLWNWDRLKQKIARVGLRNSLLVAPMPTASTSQILGFNECFEPYTRYERKGFYL